MLPEVGATELLVIAAIALIVVGPKDLPVMLRKLGQFLARMRAMAADFRASFDEMARQSELDELRREVEAIRSARDPLTYIAGDAAYDPDAARVITDIQEGLTASPPVAPAPIIEGPAEPAPAPKPRQPRAKKVAAKPAPAPRKPRARKTPETPA